MIINFEDLKKFLNKVNKENIHFIPYFYMKKQERPYISENLVKEKIKDINNILGFQRHVVKGEYRYRVGIKLSGRYTLVVVCEIKDKDLNIITAWKTNRKWQKSIQK
ncbi:MAG: hypothetical protein ACE5ES_02525 [Candidatus Nanoarchaeia archaeon]